MKKKLVLLLCLVVGCGSTTNNYFQNPNEDGGVPMAGSPAPMAGQGGSAAGSGGSVAGSGGSIAQGGSGGNLSQAGSGGVMWEPQGGSGGSDGPHTMPTTCPKGFDLKENQCSDINECLSNPCGALDCVNEPGTYQCAQPGATWRNIEIQAAEVNPTGLVQSQRTTCRVTFQNNGTDDYTVPRLIVTVREPGEPNFGGRGDDFLDLRNVTIPANSGITYTPTYEFRTDRPTGMWRCYGTHQDNAGAWHDGVSANITVQPLVLNVTLSPLSNPIGYHSAGPGEAIQGILTVQNPQGFSVQVTAVAAGRRPGALHSGGPANDMTPSIVTMIQAGQQAQQAVSVTNQAFPQGSWEFYPTWRDQYEVWHDGASQFFEVRPSDDSIWGDTSSYSVSGGPLALGPWACWDDSDPEGVVCTEWEVASGYGQDVAYTVPQCPTGGVLMQHPCPTNQMLYGTYTGKNSGPNFFLDFIYAPANNGTVAYWTANPAYFSRDPNWVGR